jgi:ABC-type transport system involved in cytochrome bd biosynthesis fused ATPase/permease subunit
MPGSHSSSNHAGLSEQKALRELLEGRTSIVIVHRMSSIEAADQVIYMEHGKVREQGRVGRSSRSLCGYGAFVLPVVWRGHAVLV